jgi:hypothetical protein
LTPKDFPVIADKNIGGFMGFINKINALFENLRYNHEVLGMSNITPEDSGIKGVVLWASTGTVAGKKLKHGPRLTVYLGTSIVGAESVSVTLTNPPRVLGEMPRRVEKDVLKFIDLNFDLLIAHWENKISSKTFLLNLKSV